MPENIFSLTIGSCHGYSSFIRSLLEHKNFSPSTFFGAYIDDSLVGFGEWRRMGEVLFLNHIYILPQYRGSRIGKKLWNTQEYVLSKYKASRIELDVFNWNEKAIKWYTKLGFQPIKTYEWYIKKSSNRPDSLVDFYIHNLPEATCMQKEYGFSQLEISIEKARYQVGRLGDQYFKINGFDPLLDNSLISALSVFDSKRDYFIVVNKDEKTPKDIGNLSYITSVTRMSLSI